MNDIENYKILDSIMVREMDEVLMIFNRETGDMLEINDTGKEIFDMLKKQLPFSTIVKMLCDKYVADEKEITEDTMEFINRLIDVGIICFF